MCHQLVNSSCVGFPLAFMGSMLCTFVFVYSLYLIAIFFFQFYLKMPPFKLPPNFKFKYFNNSYNPSNGTLLPTCDAASSSKGQHQSFYELAILKRKCAIEILMICLSASILL